MLVSFLEKWPLLTRRSFSQFQFSNIHVHPRGPPSRISFFYIPQQHIFFSSWEERMEIEWDEFVFPTSSTLPRSYSLNFNETMDPSFLLPYCDYCGQKHLHKGVTTTVYEGKTITICKPGTGCSKSSLIIKLAVANVPDHAHTVRHGYSPNSHRAEYNQPNRQCQSRLQRHGGQTFYGLTVAGPDRQSF